MWKNGDTVSTVSVTVTGALAIDGSTVGTGTQVLQHLQTTGNLEVAGYAAITGALNVDGAADFDSTLDVAGETTLRSSVAALGTLTVTGAATLESTLLAKGAASVKGLATLARLSVSGELADDGHLTVAKTSTLTGAVSCGSTLAVTGDTTLGEDLTVAGTSTTTGLATAKGGLKVGNGTGRTIAQAGFGWKELAVSLAEHSGTTTTVDVSATDSDIAIAGSSDARFNVSAGAITNGSVTVDIRNVTSDGQAGTIKVYVFTLKAGA